MRLVLDTNILLSALLTRGTPPDLLYQAWRQGDFELVSSAAQIEEVTRVLDYPHLRERVRSAEAAILVDGLKNLATLAEYLPDIHLSRDADDDKILATALAGQADYLVSGDKDLLSLPETCGVKIVTPRDAIDIIKSQKG
ncbi:MAG: putative toxin-antitoxin system toxin component, PIN family [Candidatus Competibacteraceae bacterium]